MNNMEIKNGRFNFTVNFSLTKEELNGMICSNHIFREILLNELFKADEMLNLSPLQAELIELIKIAIELRDRMLKFDDIGIGRVRSLNARVRGGGGV